MYYVVYLDVFLIINIFMDFLILVVAKKFFKPQTTLLKCFLGALGGGVLSVFSLMIPYKILWLRFITSYVVICLFMCLMTFGFKGLRNSIKSMVCVYFATFLLGGTMNALYYHTIFGFMLNKILSRNYFSKINIMRFVCIVLITYLVTNFILKEINIKKDNKVRIYKIKLSINERSTYVNALLDTGNLLKEPISGRDVHIIEAEVLKDIIGEDYLKNGVYRIIPYNSVGNEKGILPGIEADCMEIYIGGEKSVIKIDKPLIAIYDKRLSSKGEFFGLLNNSVNELIVNDL